MNAVDVSVVICVRNGAQTILRQCDALDRQVNHPPFEIIICDNGSTDSTTQVVKRWMDTSHHVASHIRLIDASAKAGIPYARNCGIKMAQGRLVTFCDADDEVFPDWVAAVAKGTPDGGIAGGRILARHQDGTPAPDTFPDGLQRHRFLPFAANCNLAATRELLVSLHGYDESLPRYGYEDVDLSWRVQLSGRPIAYIPDATIWMTLSPPRTAMGIRFQLGQGRVLMAHRYPDYDPYPYSVATCTRNLVLGTLVLIKSALGRDRSVPPRRAASILVSTAGTLWGVLAYTVFGTYPEPHLLTTPAWSASTPEGSR
ncbi:glycosyltransferase family 2 protein [Acidipropionibacterium timonense]|uniref:glycosyltransferase family 2 protein n=1 Tax=Acidipropionibacterium timonense TaxID=2161818 RepID=UPI001031AECB|nr:glycosyltransferase family A protein [Acidipropionibacterium timonense]